MLNKKAVKDEVKKTLANVGDNIEEAADKIGDRIEEEWELAVAKAKKNPRAFFLGVFIGLIIMGLIWAATSCG